MQIFQNSSSLIFGKSSFLDNKILKNQNSEEKTQSNSSSLRNNSSLLSGQESESTLGINDEDSNNIFGRDIRDKFELSEESIPFFINLNEKSLGDKNYSLINQSNNIDENISIDKIEKSFSLSQNKYIINESNENDGLFTHKINEDAEKMSGLSGDSFISFDFPQNQDFIIVENESNSQNLMIDEGRNDSFDNNIKEPLAEEIKEKLNLSKNSDNIDKKKEKINLFISRKDSYNLMNIENNNINNDNKNNEEKKKSKFFKNKYTGKKRDIEKKIKDPGQISKDAKLNNLHEINKVTIISQKAFKCECGKVFSTEENQRLHYINIHLHEKPYNCSFCGEGFSHRNGKIYHERVYHTFIFPYPCTECEKAFASKSAMIYHMKSKHKINK